GCCPAFGLRTVTWKCLWWQLSASATANSHTNAFTGTKHRCSNKLDCFPILGCRSMERRRRTKCWIKSAADLRDAADHLLQLLISSNSRFIQNYFRERESLNRTHSGYKERSSGRM